MEKLPPRVFISYAKEDVKTAKQIYFDLRQAGAKPWMDEFDLQPGQHWQFEIRKAIKEYSYFLVILSSHSVHKRGYVQKELKMALDLLDEFPETDIYVIPARLDQTKPIGEKLERLQWVDLFLSYQEGLRKILHVIFRDDPKYLPSDTDSHSEEHNEVPDKTGKDNVNRNIEVSGSKGFFIADHQTIQGGVHIHVGEKPEKGDPPKKNKIIPVLLLIALAGAAAGIAVIYQTYPKPAPAPMIRVMTNPTGASVFLNGDRIGVSDIEKTVTPGRFRIRVQLNGYESEEKHIDIESNSKRDVSFNLKPAIPGKTMTNKFGMEFVYLHPDEFIMGSPTDETGRDPDEVQHEVVLRKGFFIQTAETTQGQWADVMGNNPSHFTDCGTDCPVESVSWNDIQVFVIRLNQWEDGYQYALPTEAQWEYAARAGAGAAFATGNITNEGCDGDPILDALGWYCGNAKNQTRPVRQKSPNAWNVYDMHGNVREWCRDWYGSFTIDSLTDPTGPASGDARVLRGGSWESAAWLCRSASRHKKSPDYRSDTAGFRLVAIPNDKSQITTDK